MRGFSLDSLFLSLNTSWQNLFVANPSVAKVIFLSNSKDTSLSDNDDAIVLFDVDVDERRRSGQSHVWYAFVKRLINKTSQDRVLL